MTGKHEQLALDKLRVATQWQSDPDFALDDANADLLMAADIVSGIRAAGTMLLALEAIEEDSKQTIARIRAALAEVMAETGATEVALPHHTLALVEPKPRPFVSDASALPAEFMVTPPPKPDMDAIKAALKRGPVAGVTMTNGSAHIRITSRGEKQ